MATLLFIFWLALALFILPRIASSSSPQVIRVRIEHGRYPRSEDLVRMLSRGRGR